MKAKRPTGFLNVDLEIESSGPLDVLGEEMGNAVMVLYSGPSKSRRYLLSLESSKSPNTADAAVRSLCSAVDQLSARGRRLWDRATCKVFDVGYELPTEVRAVNVTLQPETVRRIVALGATITFTCYRQTSANSAV